MVKFNNHEFPGSLLDLFLWHTMSVDTLTTCATVQRKCRSRGKEKKSNLRKDLTCRSEFADVKTPEVHIQEDLGLNVSKTHLRLVRAFKCNTAYLIYVINFYQLLDVCDIPEDMLFPGEFNVYLQDKLKVFKILI